MMQAFLLCFMTLGYAVCIELECRWRLCLLKLAPHFVVIKREDLLQECLLFQDKTFDKGLGLEKIMKVPSMIASDGFYW